MEDQRYEAEPIDTSRVRLTPELAALVPLLAENTQAVWTRQRAAEGWRYGPMRDDEDKRHPSLVRYDSLPESERAYDRIVVTEVLKVLLALGYRLERP